MPPAWVSCRVAKSAIWTDTWTHGCGCSLSIGVGADTSSVDTCGYTCAIPYSYLLLQHIHSPTMYWSQGQTIQNIIIDIRNPPSSTIMPFNIYVCRIITCSRQKPNMIALRFWQQALDKTSVWISASRRWKIRRSREEKQMNGAVN